MNIYAILLSKPHNLHHLNRYYNFINRCLKSNSLKRDLGYIEHHHICPKAKALFPEYASFEYYPGNEAVLTGRQHLIAHAMLAKTYLNTGMSLAYLRMSRSIKAGSKLNSRQYEFNKIQQAKEQSVIATEWYKHNNHPKGFLNKKHSAATKLLISATSEGKNNGMYGKSRPDLAKSNIDPVLKMVRGKSSSKTKILKNCKLYGFETTEACHDYFSKIVIPFLEMKPYLFTAKVTAKFIEDYPTMGKPTYPIGTLLHYLNINYPKRATKRY